MCRRRRRPVKIPLAIAKSNEIESIGDASRVIFGAISASESHAQAHRQSSHAHRMRQTRRHQNAGTGVKPLQKTSHSISCAGQQWVLGTQQDATGVKICPNPGSLRKQVAQHFFKPGAVAGATISLSDSASEISPNSGGSGVAAFSLAIRATTSRRIERSELGEDRSSRPEISCHHSPSCNSNHRWSGWVGNCGTRSCAAPYTMRIIKFAIAGRSCPGGQCANAGSQSVTSSDSQSATKLNAVASSGNPEPPMPLRSQMITVRSPIAPWPRSDCASRSISACANPLITGASASAGSVP